MYINLSLYITLAHFSPKEKFIKRLSILLDYEKIIMLIKTHQNIIIILLFYYYFIPAFLKALRFTPSNIDSHRKMAQFNRFPKVLTYPSCVQIYSYSSFFQNFMITFIYLFLTKFPTIPFLKKKNLNFV